MSAFSEPRPQSIERSALGIATSGSPSSQAVVPVPKAYFNYITSQLAPWEHSESPRMMEMIGHACKLENARVYQHGELNWQLNLAHCVLLFDHQPTPEEAKPLESRIILAANTAQRILRMAEGSLSTDPALAQNLHGIAAAMILIVCHAQQGCPSLHLLHDFMMQYVYRDVSHGETSTYQFRAPGLIGELHGIAQEQIRFSLERQQATNLFSNNHYAGLRQHDLKQVIDAQCRAMPSDRIIAMLDNIRTGKTQEPLPDKPNPGICLTTLFYHSGKDELFGRDLRVNKNYGLKSARAAFEARFGCVHTL
ncbi:MAG: hypothetical protein EYC62_02385 [Alphaproteobacteria bacterium]|nr:MAG: hypothetical protein EYC62_02385 [Alphaproteobacteria bacterium]